MDAQGQYRAAAAQVKTGRQQDGPERRKTVRVRGVVVEGDPDGLLGQIVVGAQLLHDPVGCVVEADAQGRGRAQHGGPGALGLGEADHTRRPAGSPASSGTRTATVPTRCRSDSSEAISWAA